MFNPFWVAPLNLLIIFLDYQCYCAITLPLITWGNVIRCLVTLFLSFLFLPLSFKMVFNIPALILTSDSLKNNFSGYSINLADIADIEYSEGGLQGFWPIG